MTGKGGVGKSFFAAAFAQALALKMKANADAQPILLAEFNDTSFYSEYLGVPEISYVPTKTTYYDIAQWSGNDCLKEYALHLLKIQSLYKLFFENPISKALIDVSPGLQELAILGKATSHPRKHGPPLKYSQMVFDAFSTGHFMTMFRAPLALAETIQFGPMGEQSRSIDQWIRNKDFCEVHIVCLPEELPSTETVELYKNLKKEFGLTAKVYMNKYFDLKQEDLKTETGEVQKYFLNLLEQQTQAEKILHEHKIKFHTVPLIPEVDVEKLIHAAAEHIVRTIL